MPDGTSFTLTDAADILAPYVETERRRDQVWQADFDRRAAEGRGLSTYIGEPPRLRSEAELRQAAAANVASLEARRASPRGQASAAIARARRICAENDLRDLHSALQALDAAMERGDGGEGRAVARVVYAVGRVPEGPARAALTALASEIAEHVRATL
jgi:hypothetical protein